MKLLSRVGGVSLSEMMKPSGGRPTQSGALSRFFNRSTATRLSRPTLMAFGRTGLSDRGAMLTAESDEPSAFFVLWLCPKPKSPSVRKSGTRSILSIFRSGKELGTAIREHIDIHNKDPTHIHLNEDGGPDPEGLARAARGLTVHEIRVSPANSVWPVYNHYRTRADLTILIRPLLRRGP